MTKEIEPENNNDESYLSFSQSMYSSIFLNKIYPEELFPNAEVYQESSDTFFRRFVNWKKDQQNLLTNADDPEKQQNIESLEHFSLFDVKNAANRSLGEFKEILEEPKSLKEEEELARKIKHMEWVQDRATAASELWMGK